MKAPQIIIFFIFLCLNFSLFSQSNPQDPSELAQTYSNYFSLNREAVFLHLNKTKLAPEEDIWFSAYSFSPQFILPNLPTTNLHVNLYNSDGKLMEAKTISMTEANGEGFFELDPEYYTPGKYLIRAGTKYMENFNEDATYTQSFTIIGKKDTPVLAREYDLQILAEGGHLVANIQNFVGLKLIDNLGQGVAFKTGRILNDSDEVLISFKSNRFGISKFNFKPEIGGNYRVKITLENGEKIEMPVPESEERGIGLSSTSMGDKMLFNFKTNKETFKSIEGKTFLFAFHKDGAMKALNFTFSKVDLSANLTINKDALYSGVNTITVFNEDNEPVLERLVFNRDSIKRKHISATYKTQNLDSLQISLSSKEVLKPHSMSISVLPAETVSYEPNNNILSAFYLEPYVRGNIENGGYYFSDYVNQRRRDYDLDLLLLTQGWSKYSWENIFKETPKEKYAHEQGFTITGNIAGKKVEPDTDLFIGSPTEDLSMIVDVNKYNSFKAENVSIKDSSMVSFSIVNTKSRESKPVISAKISPVRDSGSIKVSKNFQVNLNNGEQDSVVTTIPANFISGVEELGTVYIEGEVLTEEDKNRELERELNGADMYGRTEVFTKEEARNYSSILSYLRTRGFTARGSTIYSRRELIRKPAGTKMGLPAIPTLIIIDGMESTGTNLSMLRPSDVDWIYVNKTGTGRRAYSTGNETGGGLIEIKTGSSYIPRSEKEKIIQLTNGFATSKEFYAPRYNSYNNDVFKSYGVIDWFPSISLEKRKADIQIFDSRQSLKLFIEGMTLDGALISEEILIESK